MLVDQLRRLTTNKPRTQLLLCGDFNSLPDSGVIEYLENGRIDVKHKDFLNLAYKKSLCKMISHSPDEEMYNHQFQVSELFKMIKRWHLDYYTNLFEQEYTQWQNSVVEATRLVKPRYFDFGPS